LLKECREENVPNLTFQRRRIEGLVRPTVIIVDGEALYRWFVSESLATRGVHVVQCRTVAEAAHYLDRRLVADLLIVDAQTAEDEGDATRGTLRRLTASVPSLVLDSSRDTPDGYGEDAVIVDKPVDSGRLAELVEGRLHPDAQTA
jgi:response regulator RpfG family c-di-GMP phosphodiesterase